LSKAAHAVLETTLIGPSAEPGGAIGQASHGGRIGLGRKVEHSLGAHPECAVTRSKPAIERTGEPFDHVGVTRDTTAAPFAGAASGILRARNRVKLEASWIPKQNVGLHVGASRVRTQEGESEGSNAVGPPCHERIVVQG